MIEQVGAYHCTFIQSKGRYDDQEIVLRYVTLHIRRIKGHQAFSS